MDFSEAMLQRARSKPGAEAIRFVRHDLAKPFPLESAAFDRVFCCLVLDHIAALDKFFLELRRLCRPTGCIIISVMHPAMSLRGVQARFIDPASGRRISPASHAHQMSDYLMAAVRAGLALKHASEYAVDATLVAQSPRAGKYLGWPMLLLLKLAPSGV
jgi:malonyl-CoA O-methyltransferase